MAEEIKTVDTNQPDNSTPEAKGEQGNEKMFTQDDVNRIVSERLARERAKGEPDPMEVRSRELEQRERLVQAKEMLASRGYPLELAEAINMQTPEALDTSLEIINKYVSEKLTAHRPIMSGFIPASSPSRHLESEGGGIRTAMGLN